MIRYFCPHHGLRCERVTYSVRRSGGLFRIYERFDCPLLKEGKCTFTRPNKWRYKGAWSEVVR